MKKNLLLLAFCILHFASFSQLNISLKSKLPFPGRQLSNIWGYAAGGKEYALVGHSAGMSVVDVTDPANPVELFQAPGPNSIWREVRTKGTYAFVTTEGGGGLQIVNLQYLPDSIQYKNYTGDGAIAGQISNIHALQVDGNFLYLYGASAIGNGGALFINVTDPWNPLFAGQFQNWYVHDGIVRNDTAYFGHINDGFFSIVDVTNKLSPVLLAQQNTPGTFTHNTWLSDNSKVLFTTDEKPNAYVASYDVSNPSNITELDRVQQDPGSNSYPHNTYVLNDYAVTSWYTEGVVIIDGSRPNNLVITGHYDTSPLTSSSEDGDWGVYAYLPSGNLLCSDMQQGMYVLAPTYVRGCYLEGAVTDSVTGNSLLGVSVIILTTTENTSSGSSGNYACGYGVAGTYSVKFQKSGYAAQTISGVSLTNGVVTNLNVKMVPLIPFTASGMVKDAASGNSVPFANIRFTSSVTQVEVTADASGNFSLTGFYADTYDVIAGAWNFRTKCFSQTISSTSGSVVIQLDKGIYDDFSFDFGWAISSTATAGMWVIGEPVGTSYGGVQANPDSDIVMDCGNQAYVTGNGGGNVWDDDIDNGKTFITSPVFDISNYTDAYLSYYRWFYVGGSNNLNDTMKIKISNGTTTVTVETVNSSTPNNSSWVFSTYKISDFVTPSATMRVIVEAADNAPGNWVEAALDGFQVIDSANPPPPLIAGEMKNKMDILNAYPNPFSDEINIQYELNSNLACRQAGSASAPELIIYDIIGNIVCKKILSRNFGVIRMEDELPAGLYFVNIRNGKEITQTIKIAKL